MSNRQEVFITFCKLSSRIFQKELFSFEIETGLLWMGWREDKEEALKERKEKKRKSNLPLLNDLFFVDFA